MPGKKQPQGSQKPGRGRSGSRARGNKGNNQPQNRATTRNDQSGIQSVQAIARRLSAEIKRLDDVGDAVAKILPQKGETIDLVKGKYLLNMNMLKDAYKRDTALGDKIADLQVEACKQSMTAQHNTSGLCEVTKKSLENGITAVDNLHAAYKTFLKEVVVMAEVLCGCPDEQITQEKPCALSSNVSIDKQLDDLTKTRIHRVQKFNHDLDQLKKDSAFGVSTPDYNYYKKLVKHNTDSDKYPHPDKHHAKGSPHAYGQVGSLRSTIANMQLSEIFRSDQALTASLRYL
jgi:hypothetical protein